MLSFFNDLIDRDNQTIDAASFSSKR